MPRPSRPAEAGRAGRGLDVSHAVEFSKTVPLGQATKKPLTRTRGLRERTTEVVSARSKALQSSS